MTQVEVVERKIGNYDVVELIERGNIGIEQMNLAADLSKAALDKYEGKAFFLVNLSEVTSFTNMTEMVRPSERLLNESQFKEAICVLPLNSDPVSKFLIRLVGQIIRLKIMFRNSVQAAETYIGDAT